MKAHSSDQKKTVSRANANQPFLQKKSEKDPFFKPEVSENSFFSKSASFSPPLLNFSFTPIQEKKNENLPEDLQSKMEDSFGQDFSIVNIQKNSQEAVDLNARAFTKGDSIHFAPGEFNPNSEKGKNLIGHEFAHVTQQRNGVVKPTIVMGKGLILNDNEELEREADNFGKMAVTGELVPKYQSSILNMRNNFSTIQTKSNFVQLEENAEQDHATRNELSEKLSKAEQLSHESRRLQTKHVKSGDLGLIEAPPTSVLDVLHSPGRPLDAATRSFMEPRFGYDFSQVRIHADAKAEESARAVNALAYTVGRDIAFGPSQYAPETNEGRSLIAHELTHVVQQSASNASNANRLVFDPPHSDAEQEATAFAHVVSRGLGGSDLPLSNIGIQVQRQPRPSAGIDNPRKNKLNYSVAKKLNESYAKPDSLGWDNKLQTIPGDEYKDWPELWKTGKYDDFADKVAEFQKNNGFDEKEIDGILGLKTWSKIAGLGEAIAGIQKVQWEVSENYCTMATRERIMRGHMLAYGKTFELPKDRSARNFDIILQSIVSRMADIDQEYRGTGAAGALVYAGLGTFVNEAGIWAGDLKPGAAIQVWADKRAYDLLQMGEIRDEETEKPRRIREIDANFFGTSYVFVRYDDPAKPTKMLVRHFGGTQWIDPSYYEVYIAANVN